MRGTAYALTSLICGFLIFAGLATQPAASTPPADAIIVLTGGEDRIVEALRLLSGGRAKRLLISGVNPHTTRAEIEKLAPEYGSLFDCCIDLGRLAQDTVGNAEESEAWVSQHGYSRVIIVTSGYHLARGLTEFSRAMPGVDLIAHPVPANGAVRTAWLHSPAEARRLMIEYCKLLPALARFGATRLFGTAPHHEDTVSEIPAAQRAAID